jgi:hypothetical protein
LGGALTLYREQERICRELGNPEDLSISLANQALIVKCVPGKSGKARLLADEALRIAISHKYLLLVPQFQRIRDGIPAE